MLAPLPPPEAHHGGARIPSPMLTMPRSAQMLMRHTTLRRPPRARRSLVAALAVALALLPLRMLSRVETSREPEPRAPAERTHGAAPRTPTLMALLPARRDTARSTLYLVMRDVDCRGHLQLLALLDRPHLALGLARGGVLLLGSDSTAQALRRMLTAHRLDHPVRIAPADLLRPLIAVSPAQTPLVLVADVHGGLRYLAPAPATLDDEARLARDLATLATPPITALRRGVRH